MPLASPPFVADPDRLQHLERQGQPKQDLAFRGHRRVPRICVLKVEAIIEEVSHVKGKQAPPMRQAVTDGSVHDPESIATRQNIIRRKPVLEISVLIDIGGLEPRSET